MTCMTLHASAMKDDAPTRPGYDCPWVRPPLGPSSTTGALPLSQTTSMKERDGVEELGRRPRADDLLVKV
jgi:hypothetical protein